MERTVIELRKVKGGTIVIDGATNLLSKSMSNVIVHTPLPFFIEYLKSNLYHETTRNVVYRLKDVMERLDERVGFKYSKSSTSDSCNGMAMCAGYWWMKGW